MDFADFQSIYKSINPTEQSILEAVDEYTLYCFYTGLDDLVLGKAYSAPYRNDSVPSFSVYPSRKEGIEYMWKDHATGESGSIFLLIRKIENLASGKDALFKVIQDFGLDFDSETPKVQEKIVRYSKPVVNKAKITIIDQPFTAQGKEYWNRLSVGEELLKFYNVSQVKYYWTFEGQPAPNLAPDPTFAYDVGGHYQLYSPFAERQFKFRNDLPENYFFGYLQLPSQGDKLIIDKSCKDLIFCKRLDYWAIAPKSETTMIPEKKMVELKERFTTIYLTLDNDEAGRRAATKYAEKYPYLVIRFLEGFKDKTDACMAIGFDKTKVLVDKMLQ
jgi:hypothetical protein